MNFFLRVVALLGALVFASALGRAQNAVVALPPGPKADLVFNGVVFIGQDVSASISDRSTGQSVWLNKDGRFRGYTAKEITAKSIVLVDSRGAETVLTLASGGRNDGSPAADAKPHPYSKAWINSMANPMVRRMQPLPLDVVRKWPTMTEEEKAAFLEMYRRHGWKLVSSDIVAGSVNFVWENIYAQERQEMLRANLAAFEATLSTEQAAQHRLIKAGQPIYAVNGAITPEQQKEVDERRKRSAEFRNSFTPAQREAFEASTDFTKGKWTD